MSASNSERRRVRYETFDELLADAEACAERQAATRGNWSLGQIFEHLATVLDKSIDGFGFTAPWFARMVGRRVMPRLLRNGMPAGYRLRGEAARELVPPESVSTEAGLAHLRRSIARMQHETARAPHPFFGALSREDADGIQLRHAELHMSFVSPP